MVPSVAGAELHHGMGCRMSPNDEGFTPNIVANIMFSAAKGDDKVPPLKKVCDDFPTHINMACRDMFINKLLSDDVIKVKDKDAMKECVRAIERRYNMRATHMRSPCPDLHRLLKEEK